MSKEQQERTEKALLDLIKVADTYLRIEFVSDQRRSEYGDRKIITSVIKGSRFVKLILVEPLNKIELDQWAEVIVKAEEILGELEKERAWQNQNPDFFSRIVFKHQNLK